MLYAFSALALDGRKWSASDTDQFYPWETVPSSHCIQGRLGGPQSHYESDEREKFPYWGSNSSQLVHKFIFPFIIVQSTNASPPTTISAQQEVYVHNSERVDVTIRKTSY
jgi:hypothetical protein